MALEAEHSVNKRIVAPFSSRSETVRKPPFDLLILPLCIVEVKYMKPVRTPLVTEKSLALCNFVCVMGESIVNAAAVNVKIFTAMLIADA